MPNLLLNLSKTSNTTLDLHISLESLNLALCWTLRRRTPMPRHLPSCGLAPFPNPAAPMLRRYPRDQPMALAWHLLIRLMKFVHPPPLRLRIFRRFPQSSTKNAIACGAPRSDCIHTPLRELRLLPLDLSALIWSQCLNPCKTSEDSIPMMVTRVWGEMLSS